MPIDVQIDPVRRIVTATPRGVLSFEDLADYQQRVWQDAEVAGFDELVDMGAVTQIVGGTLDNLRHLAQLARSMDRPDGPTRLAIVARSDFHYGMARMYQALREEHPGATKAVRVFREREEADRWLSATGVGDA